MAHVLLPCDLPSWGDVQRHIGQLKACKDGERLADLMARIHEICCISLDPEECQPRDSHPGFQTLQRFLDESLAEPERSRFFERALPNILGQALCLRLARPPHGFLYSLKKEECTFELERSFVVSLLANAFLSTFPRRNAKTHPTLQDFSFADFFTHLDKSEPRHKLKAFLQYFETLDTKPKGVIKFSRKVVGGPSLPGWLCSDHALAPLVVRHEGDIHGAESHVFRACYCSSLIGGNVLGEADSEEAKLFFTFPELLVSLSFIECLGDNEALIVEGVQPDDAQCVPETREVNFCFLDAAQHPPDAQFEDRVLLRELNKALAAFSYAPREMPRQRRQTPVGESSGSSRRKSSSSDVPPEPKKSISKVGPKEEEPAKLRRNPGHVTSGLASAVDWPLLASQMRRSYSRGSSRGSMKTASQSSIELTPVQPVLVEEEYYTADEDSNEERPRVLPRDRLPSAMLCELLKEDVSERTGASAPDRSLSRGSSVGFVLGDDDEEAASRPSSHERLEDFRKRIRKRTRRRASRRSSYASSSGSSDMDDISEDPELPDVVQPCLMRPASSEPSLATAALDAGDCGVTSCPVLSPSAEAVLVTLSGRKMMVTSSNGQLKAYSYDGVNPNLPVPFKAKFRRRRRHRSDERDPPEHLLLWSTSALYRGDDDVFAQSPTPSEASRIKDSSYSLATTDPEEEESIPGPSRLPVAAEPWRGLGSGFDPQLRTVILWLAASVAELPFFVVYAAQEPTLKQMVTVYNKVLSRQWTVGDLSCEVLRFCRNRLSPRHKNGARSQLFGQLLGTEVS